MDKSIAHRSIANAIDKGQAHTAWAWFACYEIPADPMALHWLLYRYAAAAADGIGMSGTKWARPLAIAFRSWVGRTQNKLGHESLNRLVCPTDGKNSHFSLRLCYFHYSTRRIEL